VDEKERIETMNEKDIIAQLTALVDHNGPMAPESAIEKSLTQACVDNCLAKVLEAGDYVPTDLGWKTILDLRKKELAGKKHLTVCVGCKRQCYDFIDEQMGGPICILCTESRLKTGIAELTRERDLYMSHYRQLLDETPREKLGLARGVTYEVIGLLREMLERTKDGEPEEQAVYQCVDCDKLRRCTKGAFVCSGCLGMNGQIQGDETCSGPHYYYSNLDKCLCPSPNSGAKE